MTDFRDRLDALAEAKRAARRAEVERLLAENPGRLLRASEVPPPEAALAGDPCRLDDLMGPCRRVAVGDGEVLVFTHEVALSAASPVHHRGYLFLPEPARALPAADALADAFTLLAGLTPEAPVALERIAFLDTETTGIGGSAGTRAFLIGIGYFTNASAAPAPPDYPPDAPRAPVADTPPTCTPGAAPPPDADASCAPPPRLLHPSSFILHPSPPSFILCRRAVLHGGLLP